MLHAAGRQLADGFRQPGGERLARERVAHVVEPVEAEAVEPLGQRRALGPRQIPAEALLELASEGREPPLLLPFLLPFLPALRAPFAVPLLPDLRDRRVALVDQRLRHGVVGGGGVEQRGDGEGAAQGLVFDEGVGGELLPRAGAPLVDLPFLQVDREDPAHPTGGEILGALGHLPPRLRGHHLERDLLEVAAAGLGVHAGLADAGVGGEVRSLGDAGEHVRGADVAGLHVRADDVVEAEVLVAVRGVGGLGDDAAATDDLVAGDLGLDEALVEGRVRGPAWQAEGAARRGRRCEQDGGVRLRVHGLITVACVAAAPSRARRTVVDGTASGKRACGRARMAPPMPTDTPETPFSLSDALVDDLAALRPVMATFYGVPGQDHRFDDFSPEGVAHVASRLRAFRDRVAALPPQAERWSALAVHVMRDWLDRELSSIAHGDHLTDLNSIASTFQNVRMVFDAMDTSSAAGWEAVAARLESIGGALDGYRRSLEAGLAASEVVAARQVRAAVGQGRVHQGEGSYFRGLPAAFAASGVRDAALAARIERAVPGACAAYGALADWLEQAYLPRAKAEDGVGRARYLREMRRWLGSTPDPEETYAWGWREVAGILGEMQRLAASIAPGLPLPEVYERVRRDASLAAPDRASLLAAMAERQRRALAELDGEHFDVPEAIRAIEVKEAPPGGPLGAYYTPPSEDFARKGTVWYSLSGEGPFPLWDEISTAYHEGFPGHHLQCGIQVSLTQSLCRLHRVAGDYAGYAEGWALYAERLMRELGYYEEPAYELGMLANAMIRACRVVFDIGAHLGLAIPMDAPFHPGERWSFDLGVEMMRTLGGLTPEHAESEVTRYLGVAGAGHLVQGRRARDPGAARGAPRLGRDAEGLPRPRARVRQPRARSPARAGDGLTGARGGVRRAAHSATNGLRSSTARSTARRSTAFLPRCVHWKRRSTFVAASKARCLFEPQWSAARRPLRRARGTSSTPGRCLRRAVSPR